MHCIELIAQIWKLKLKMIMHGMAKADGENQAIRSHFKTKAFIIAPLKIVLYLVMASFRVCFFQ